MLRGAGADIVSMSAAVDALACREEGLEVACLSCVTNSVGLWRGSHPDHDGVLKVACSSREALGEVISSFVGLVIEGGWAN